MKSLVELKVAEGEPISAEAWNALVDAIRSAQILGGSNVRVNRTPNGTFVTALPGALPVSGAFAVSLGSSTSGQVCTVSRGLIDGIEPVINEKKISGDPEQPDELPPTLPLPKPSAAEGYIYLECMLGRESWRITKAEITFEAKPPAAKEWTAYKLIAILRKADTEWQVAHQAVHFNLGHYPYGHKSSGKARHLFFAR